MLNRHLLKRIKLKALSIFVAEAVLMTLLAGLFIVPLWGRVLAGLLSAMLLASATIRFLDYKAEKVCREQTELLLQFLSTETSSGRSLDSAFIDAPLHFAKLFSRKSRFQAGLEQISAGLRLQIPLHVLIRDFAGALDSQEARIVLQVLTTMDFSGTDLPEILHQEGRILGDIKRIERQVAAENAQQSTEALILCLLPFLAMILLRMAAADYMSDSFTSELGQMMLLISFLLAIFALILNVLFRSTTAVKPKDESLISLKKRLAQPSLLSKLAAKVLGVLPKAYVLRIYGAMRILWTLRDTKDENLDHFQYQAGIDELNVWCQLKLLWFVLSIPLTILGVRLGLPFFYVFLLVIALPLFQDQELLSRAGRYQNELMQGLPLFISLMNQLLKSGMVVRRALLFTIQQMPVDSALYRELKLIETSMSGGLNAAPVLGEFSARLDIPEAQTALLLLARQETHGGPEMLRQLNQASQDCWSILGSAYRKKHEMLSQRMFLPMLLDMFSVVVMGAAPAMLMFMR